MITGKELELLTLSATKKDYYQIWGELLEVASKLSERWDPQSTNETDPGIVLLKTLVALADKLNYNIDKNTLEAFMPSAAQEESMRKLCDMMGYAIKYYLSATTTVTLSYTGNVHEDETALPVTGLEIPMFTAITNADNDVTYVTTTPAILLNDQPTVEIPCIEGQVVRCENDTDNIVSLAHLDEDNRYYLPEIQIAENGIFIYNISDNIKSEAWTCVDNLNTQPAKSKVYKFGFDSMEYRPYIQFPDDISNLIEDGLEIYYIRTSGAAGNITTGTLSTFEKPSTDEWKDFSGNDSFVVTNYSTVTNGRNPETIQQAYNSFKKTVGTFDTLVTCRDYMNKIYNLAVNQNTYLVSNVIVSDIRDDLNRAQTICSFNDFGVCYVDTAVKDKEEGDLITPFNLILYPFKTYNNLGTINDYKGSFTYSASNFNLINSLLEENKTIAHQFTLPRANDIVCIKNYLKLNAKIATVNRVSSVEENQIISNIKMAIYNAFNMRELDFGYEIPFETILGVIINSDTRIKNVSLEEPVLYTKFLCANGKEFDCASADAEEKTEADKLYNKLALRNIMAGRIKMFNYDTSFSYDFTEVESTAKLTLTEEEAKEFGDTGLNGGLVKGENAGDKDVYTYAPVYPTQFDDAGELEKEIRVLKSELKLDVSNDALQNGGITLKEHEVIKFRAPNFITTKTFPAYVNYFLHLDQSHNYQAATPATFYSLGFFLNSQVSAVNKAHNLVYTQSDWTGAVGSSQPETYWDLLINYLAAVQDQRPGLNAIGTANIQSDADAKNYNERFGAIFSPVSGSHGKVKFFKIPINTPFQTGIYRYINFSENIFSIIVQFIQELCYKVTDETAERHFLGLYRKVASAGQYQPGYMVDAGGIKYGECTIWRTYVDPFYNGYFVQNVHGEDALTPDPSSDEYDSGLDSYHTADGLGMDSQSTGIPAGSEYQLKAHEYLLINYTPASTQEDTGGEAETVNEIYKTGDIIKPNFVLEDSDFRYNTLGKAYSKTSGFDFSRADASIPNPSGMYSFGTSEQVEVRSLVQVTLKNMLVNLYWSFDNANNTLLRDQMTQKADGSRSYTLKPGEYLYYTNERKQDIAYYGEGTELLFYGRLELDATDGNVTALSAEEVDALGPGRIPWHCYDLHDNNYLMLREYQYVTLTEGDSLLSLELSSAATSPTELCNEWQPCKTTPIKYAIGDTKYTLPTLAVENMSWEARSLLEFATGPDTPQTLRSKGASITAYADDEAKNVLIKIAPTTETTEDDGEKVNEISIKTNQYIVASTDTVYYKQQQGQEDDSVAGSIDVPPLFIKVFNIKDIKIESPQETLLASTLNLHNVDNTYTQLSMANLKNDEGEIKRLELPITVPNNDFALMMIYCAIDNQDVIGNTIDNSLLPGISIVGEAEDTPKIYNYSTSVDAASSLEDYMSSWTWWQDRVETKDKTIYKLNTGINMVYFRKSMVINIEPDERAKALIIFSDPTIIKEENAGLDNSIIDYRSDSNFALQMLRDILALDTKHQFYYNCPIDNNIALDLFGLRQSEDDYESLASPRTWYDTNNINNKFVISEIDADYLTTGLQIAKSSKR